MGEMFELDVPKTIAPASAYMLSFTVCVVNIYPAEAVLLPLLLVHLPWVREPQMYKLKFPLAKGTFTLHCASVKGQHFSFKPHCEWAFHR